MNLPPLFRKDKEMVDDTRPKPSLPLPAEPRLPASGQAYAPPRMRSAAYAQAQAEWDAIENELAYTKDQCDSLRAQLRVAEETIKALKLDRQENDEKAEVEMAKLKADNERLLRENITIGSSVGRAVDVLIGLRQEMERIKNGHPALDPAIEDEAKLAIERAMHEEKDPH